jgi:hypothetical protein
MILITKPTPDKELETIMSANAGTWFYREPEHQPYLITERLNGTFWQARIVRVYWRCVKAEPPFRAEGYLGDRLVEMEWMPGQWLALKGPAGDELATLAESISQRVLSLPAALTYTDPQGRQIYEWHVDGGKRRWIELQGRPEFIHPRRLTA